MEYDEFDYLYGCINCGKYIGFSEYIKNDNCCDDCSQKNKENNQI